MDRHLGEFEQLILFSLIHLGSDAYGVSIRKLILERTGREVSSGAIYTTLERLEKRGLVKSTFGEPTPARGGRRKKFFALEPAGAIALNRSFTTLHKMVPDGGARLAALVEGQEAGN